MQDNAVLSDNEITRILDAMKCQDEVHISDPIARSKHSIESCHGCHRDLNWPMSKVGFWASPVNCPECDNWYFVECHNHQKPLLTAKAAALLNQQKTSPPDQAEPVPTIFGDLPYDDALLTEQYETAWHNACSWVVGVPLTEEIQPDKVATKMTLVDLTYSYATLVATETFSSPLLLLDFTPIGTPQVQLLASALWKQCANGSTKIGCRFLHAPGTPLPLQARC